MIIQQDMDLMKKLTILSDAAKYDAACTSSGVDKKNNGAGLGNAKACGICHSFSADGRCISLLKILFTNECIYNCRYCVNRSSNDVPHLHRKKSAALQLNFTAAIILKDCF